MRPRPLAAGAVLLALLAGCKSPEEKLVDRRREQRDRLERLYERLGAGAAPPREEGAAGAFVGRILGEADRAHFEQQCLSLGRGERTFALSPKVDAFLRREDVQAECRRAVDLQLEIEALERAAAPR